MLNIRLILLLDRKFSISRCFFGVRCGFLLEYFAHFLGFKFISAPLSHPLHLILAWPICSPVVSFHLTINGDLIDCGWRGGLVRYLPHFAYKWPKLVNSTKAIATILSKFNGRFNDRISIIPN